MTMIILFTIGSSMVASVVASVMPSVVAVAVLLVGVRIGVDNLLWDNHRYCLRV